MTEKNELIQLNDRLSKEDKGSQEIWEELKEEGKTDREIADIFMDFGFVSVFGKH